jgi:hypothetical protein
MKILGCDLHAKQQSIRTLARYLSANGTWFCCRSRLWALAWVIAALLARLRFQRLAVPFRIAEMKVRLHEVIDGEVVLFFVEPCAAADDLLELNHRVDWPHKDDVPDIAGIHASGQFLRGGQNRWNGPFIVLKVPQISAQDVHPWGTGCGAARPTRRIVSRPVDGRLGKQSRPKRSDCCHREQTGQDQLGCTVERGKLSTQVSSCSCQLDEVTLKFASQKSAEEKEGRKYSQMACPRTCVVIRSFTTVAIIKDGHARIIIMCPETILH